MSDVKSGLAAILLVVLVLSGCDRAPSTPAPTAKAPKPPSTRPVQVEQLVQSTQPKPASPDPATTTAPASEWDAVDLNIPADITANIARQTGRPFPECTVQLTDLNGRPKLVTHGGTESDVEFIVEEMGQERRKGTRRFAGWIVMRTG